MTPTAFRKLALALEGACERAHGGHPDFRAAGKVFATMGYPDEDWAMVKLTPDQQRMLCAAEPAIFQPVRGGWGLRGATNLKLAPADQRTARSALAMALQNVTTPRAKRPAGATKVTAARSKLA